MPPKRRGRKPKNADPEPVPVEETETPEVVPEKRPKIEQESSVETESQNESMEDVKPDVELKQSTPTTDKKSKETNEDTKTFMPLWANMVQFFKKKNAKHFFQFFSVNPVSEENDSDILVTACINAAVWSQTVKTKQVKDAKETVACTVLEHFGIDREEFESGKIHVESFNIGTTPTGLLQKFLGDAHAFKVSEESKTKFSCELLVNGETVDAETTTGSRHSCHLIQAQMALRYLESNVDDFIDVVTTQQNTAQGQIQQQPPAQEFQNNQPFYGGAGAAQMVPMGDVPPGWKVVGWQQQPWMNNQQNQSSNMMSVIDQARGNAGQDFDIHRPDVSNGRIENGKKYSFETLKQMFPGQADFGSQPIQILNGICGKLKIEYKFGPNMLDDKKSTFKNTVVLTLTHPSQDPNTFSIVGQGQGKHAKNAASTAALIHLQHLENVDYQEWTNGTTEMVEKTMMKINKNNSENSFQAANQDKITGQNTGDNDGSAKHIDGLLTMIQQYVTFQRPTEGQNVKYIEAPGQDEEGKLTFTCNLSALGLTAEASSLQSKKCAKMEACQKWMDGYAASQNSTAISLIEIMVKERAELKLEKKKASMVAFKEKLIAKKEAEKKNTEEVEPAVDAKAVEEAFA